MPSCSHGGKDFAGTGWTTAVLVETQESAVYQNLTQAISGIRMQTNLWQGVRVLVSNQQLTSIRLKELFMNKTGIKLLAMAAVTALVIPTMQANPITFAGYSGAFPYTENGFTTTVRVTPNQGAWGVTGPNTIATAINLSPSVNLNQTFGGIDITGANGDLFYFNSVNLAGVNTASSLGASFNGYTFSVYGFLNGAVVFSGLGGGLVQNGTTLTSIIGNPQTMMDTLSITANFNQANFATIPFSVNGSYVFRDIDVTLASVPDGTSTLPILGLSLSALVFCYRRIKASMP